MRLTAAVVVALAWPCVSLADAGGSAGEPRVNAVFFVGLKTLEGAWQPVENQLEYGFVSAFGRSDWPVDVAVDFLASSDGGCSYFCLSSPSEGSTREIDLGVRKTWTTGKVLPYLGAGAGILHAKFTVDNGSIFAWSSATGVGFWAGAGLLIRPREHFEFGLDVRYSSAGVDLDFGYGSRRVDAGGIHYGLVMGFGM